MSRFLSNAGTLRRAAELAAATCFTLFPSLAQAHFNLSAPPNWTTESTQGDPEKEWPCGNENNAMSTGSTTPYKPGDKVTIKLTETVTHGGHYRVALATSGNMMDLPMDMSQSASGSMCQNDDMQATPAFPILADGMLEHTQSQKLSGVQSFDVTLPTNVTCDKCVLQVREYMTPHTSTPEIATQTNGCYYHHCAYISISAGAGTGGMSSGGGASSGGAPSTGAGGISGGGMPGTGGASMGGAMGEAGSVMSSGGAPGMAGGSSHAGTGAAGMPGTGGVVSGTGGGAVSGAGGTSTNTGAVGSGGRGTGGTGGLPSSASGGTTSSPATPAEEDKTSGGCGVTLHGGRAPFGFAGALGLGIWLARRRRR